MITYLFLGMFCEPVYFTTLEIAKLLCLGKPDPKICWVWLWGAEDLLGVGKICWVCWRMTLKIYAYLIQKVVLC